MINKCTPSITLSFKDFLNRIKTDIIRCYLLPNATALKLYNQKYNSNNLYEYKKWTYFWIAVYSYLLFQFSFKLLIVIFRIACLL